MKIGKECTLIGIGTAILTKGQDQEANKEIIEGHQII
jgi:hypothetical protein